MKTLSLSGLLAALATVLFFLLSLLPGGHWLDPVMRPAWILSSYVIGQNVHQPNGVALWVAFFILSLLFFYVVTSAYGLVRRRARPGS